MYALSKMKKLFLLFGFILSCTACVKDKPDAVQKTAPSESGRKVLIANEGSLGSGNGSLSVYNIDEDKVYNDVFFQKNDQKLGDVFQSILITANRIYLALNNSDKIMVIDKKDYSLIGQINVRKPRYMLLVAEDKMYVSSLFYPEINIVNPKTFQNTGSISTDFPNTEGLGMWDGKVYACNWDTACNYLYEINPKTDSIKHRIPLAGFAPQEVLMDKNQKLWVLAGNIYKGKAATITQIDPDSRNILKSYSFPPGAEIIKPVFNPGKDTLYFLGVNYDGGTAYNGVYRMSIDASAQPVQPFIAAQPLQYFWGLGIDPLTGQIYVGDPKGFIQKGEVHIYNASGKVLKDFFTNIGPGYFYFEH
jgi:DNA-binding beta-propeller fold protein YncE